MYSYNEVARIDQFYHLPEDLIDGYKLFSMAVSRGGYGYTFIPAESDRRGINEIHILFSPSADVLKLSEPFEEELMRLIENSKDEEYVAEFGWPIRYNPETPVIATPFGDGWFSVAIPDELNSYEFLRDLCHKVIRTAELIVLD
jgi:hypothetical protein